MRRRGWGWRHAGGSRGNLKRALLSVIAAIATATWRPGAEHGVCIANIRRPGVVISSAAAWWIQAPARTAIIALNWLVRGVVELISDQMVSAFLVDCCGRSAWLDCGVWLLPRLAPVTATSKWGHSQFHLKSSSKALTINKHNLHKKGRHDRPRSGIDPVTRHGLMETRMPSFASAHSETVDTTSVHKGV